MPKRCIVAGCSNTTKEGVSLHFFPKNDNLRRIWAARVKLTRANWSGPTDNSVICSRHFPDDAYEVGLYSEFNIKRRRQLKADAVPIINRPTNDQGKGEKRSSQAAEKRRKIRMLDELLAAPVVSGEISPEEEPEQTMEHDQDPLLIDEPEPEPGCSHWDSLERHSTEQCQHGQERTHAADPKLTRSFGSQVSIKRNKVATRVKKTQVSVKSLLRTRSIGCQKYDDPPAKSVHTRGTSYDPPEEEDVGAQEEPTIEIPSPKKSADPDYEPRDSEQPSSSSDYNSSPKKPKRQRRKSGQKSGDTYEWKDREPYKDAKYLVFETQLMELFAICRKCKSGAVQLTKRVNGTLLVIKQECLTCRSKFSWDSQPWFGGTPAGNLLLSAAILFSGNSGPETICMLERLRVPTISERTFYRHQEYVLEPAIDHQWDAHQTHLISELLERGLPLTVGGDGRADSPGHSAKYGVYSVMELNVKKIVDFELVQCNEVGGSYHMELEGFKRAMAFIKTTGLRVTKLVTDRHRQLAKYVRTEEKDIHHAYDVWHLAKGIRKKVHALGMQKDCTELLAWEQSISNHVYWVAASSPEEDEAVRAAKWTSLGNHIQGIHTGHSDIFPDCLHGDLENQGSRKKWLKAGTKPCEKLQDLISGKLLVKDIQKMSGGKQTSTLESFHRQINHFAPKLKAYSHPGITSRLQLAAMHYNENSDNAQATRKDGKKKFKLVKRKYEKGKATVKPLMEDATFSYVDDILLEVSQRGVNYTVTKPARRPAPPHLTSQFEYPSKEELIERHKSRFGLQE